MANAVCSFRTRRERHRERERERERERRLGIGVLTLMFVPSASYLSALAGWWIRAMARIGGQGMFPRFSVQ